VIELKLTPTGRMSPTHRRHFEEVVAQLRDALKDPGVQSKEEREGRRVWDADAQSGGLHGRQLSILAASLSGRERVPDVHAKSPLPDQDSRRAMIARLTGGVPPEI
jgi:hypothetical protein